MSLNKTLYPVLSTGSTQEARPDMTEKLLTGIESKQANIKIRRRLFIRAWVCIRINR